MVGTNFFTPKSSTIEVALTDNDGNAILAKGSSVPSAVSGYAKGCIFINTTTGKIYQNTGTNSSCSFDAIGEINTAEIADGAVTTDKLADNAVSSGKLSYEVKTLNFGATDTEKTATITSGSVIVGCYVSGITGTPNTKHCKLSISETTLTGTLDVAPGTSNGIEYTVVLIKA
ncbi:MAG: hypothetical protein QW469_00500 [Candidatus Aenigmatarchaeota archaeon]